MKNVSPRRMPLRRNPNLDVRTRDEDAKWNKPQPDVDVIMSTHDVMRAGRIMESIKTY